jgi:hypothetical protein
MSTRKLEEIKCPCGEVFEAELWNGISVSEDPDLREALLSGEINIVCCPACSEVFYAEHFLLYHDSENELLAFVYPSSFADQSGQLENKMMADFDRAMKDFDPERQFSYKPVLLFGLDALVELIRRDEEENDEAAILEYIAEDAGLSVIRLHQYLARPHRIPKALPYLPMKTGDQREKIIAGLRMLLEKNEHLSLYRELLHAIETDPQWKLAPEFIKNPEKK